MYHCHVRFYLLGHQQEAFEPIRQVDPPEAFTYEYLESDTPRQELITEADVIIADLRGMEPESIVHGLAADKKLEAELILLADARQISALERWFPYITDIWTCPMSTGEMQFRLRRWQQTFKLNRDYRETSHFLDAAIDGSPNLVWFKDKNGIHRKVNSSFCQTVNKTKEQVEGRGHAYIWDVEEDDPACIESERVVMETQKTCYSLETIQTGGGARLLSTYKSPLYDLDGSVMGTVGVAIDVTKERAYEEALAQKTQILESLFMSMDCGIMCHSLDGSKIISVNRAALELLGYESQEEMETAGFDLIAPSVAKEDRERLRESILSLKNVGENVNVEYSVNHPDGKVLHIMGNIKLIEENGEPLYQRFLLDYTAQKQRERREKQEIERRQQSLIQALATDYNLVYYYNLETKTGNPLRIHDCPYGILDRIFNNDMPFYDSLERYIQTCVHADDREMMRQSTSWERIEMELEEKESFYVNYRNICGGSLRYFQMKAVRTGEWDACRSAVLGFRSVDEETRIEMEKKNMLEDALSQANRASRAKSVFLSNMSHDIRTPMNAIIGFTALATTHIDNKEQVEAYLKKIMTSGNHLLSLINDILDMSRIESGKMHLEEKECSLPDILHSLRNIVQADVYAKQLDFYIDAVDIQHENIYCDSLRLNQVLLNLLGYSIKYTAAGGMLSIRVIEKPGAPAGSANYEFHVKDNGIGMSEDFVSRIFEPFERERNSTTSGIQGTGLGMAITKNIVEMMNGTINVKSKKSVGTEVVVSLTFRLSSAEEQNHAIPELKDCRALVVDDDYNTCDSVSWMLQQIGMRAEWTLSGREAVLRTHQAVTRGDYYSVYIIDWMLPDMNGVEVARRVRKETGENVPIIVLTAYDWSDIEDEAREAGVSAFCSKPLFLSELKSSLYSVVCAKPEKTPEEQQAIPLHTGRILLTEDNELNQEIAVAILEEAGFTVDTADNGQIAVDTLTQKGAGYYQLVLMDVQMPVMNGYEATRKIRALEDKGLAGIPILAMTANAFEEDKQEALHTGMNGHIAKPIDISELMDAIKEYVQ